MENTTSLDDILGEPAAETYEPEELSPARDEQGRFAPEDTGETQQETPPVSEPEPSHIPLAALQDERTKRQRTEDELRGVRETLQQYEAYFQQQAQPTAEEDPIAFVAQQVREQLAPQLQQELLVAKVQMAETLARQRWDDYDAKIEVFKAEAQKNPFLWKQLENAADPASHAYNVANQIADAQRFGGNPAPSREQVEAEIREKIYAEIGMSNRQAPVSMATERSTGSRSGPAWSGPTSLDSILGS